MNRQQLILIGGGGHCKSCIDVVELDGQYTIAGILDAPSKTGEQILGYTISGSDDDIVLLANERKSFLITVGQIKSAAVRKSIFGKVEAAGGLLPVVRSPRAHLSPHASVSRGTIIMHDALINAGVQIGKNCIINNKAHIEHDVVIGDHCHISTSAVINGDCILGNEVFIGSNSTLAHGVHIADNVVVGAGSVVIQHITEPGVYAGNPAKRIK